MSTTDQSFDTVADDLEARIAADDRRWKRGLRAIAIAYFLLALSVCLAAGLHYGLVPALLAALAAWLIWLGQFIWPSST